MMYKYEDEARAILDNLVSTKPEGKDEIRRILEMRKYENLTRDYRTLKKVETQAIALLRRVDYSNIQPDIVHVNPKDKPLWDYYRNVLSSAPWSARPGRCLFMFCVDKNSGGVLGIIDYGSDLFVLKNRDDYIGWSRDRRVHESGLRYLANLGTCVSSAPFGKLTGGKFMSVAVTSRELNDTWYRRYGEYVAAVTTTSLYGKSSQYNRLKEYVYLGESSGGGAAHLSYNDYVTLRKFVNVNDNVFSKHGVFSSKGGPGGGMQGRLNVIIQACNMLGVRPETVGSKQRRGVYFAPLASNSLEYLRGEDDVLLFTNDNMHEIREHWLRRWYDMRYPKFEDEVNTFDYSMYRVDNMIDYLRGRSVAGNATVPLHVDVGSTPTARSNPVIQEVTGA